MGSYQRDLVFAIYHRRYGVIGLGEPIFVIPREGGDLVFHRRFNRLLDSGLRGNDKRGSVPAFPTQLIPLQIARKAGIGPCNHDIRANRSAASMISCVIPASVIAWPASGTMRKSASGQACFKSQPLRSGVTTS